MERKALTKQTASEQRIQDEVTPEELYFAGRHILDDGVINIDVTKPEPQEGRFETIANNNAEFEKLADQWEGLWSALCKRAEAFEDISFLVTLMEECYDDMVELFVIVQQEEIDVPFIRLGAIQMKIIDKRAELEDEDMFKTMSRSQLNAINDIKHEVELCFEKACSVLYCHGDDAYNVLRGCYEEICDSVAYAKQVMQEEDFGTEYELVDLDHLIKKGSEI